MSVQGLGWLGVRTDRFGEAVSLCRDVLELEPSHDVYEPISRAGGRP